MTRFVCLEIMWNVAEILHSDGTWNLSILKAPFHIISRSNLLALMRIRMFGKVVIMACLRLKVFFNFISRSNEDEDYQEN